MSIRIGTRRLRTPNFRLPSFRQPQTRFGKILRGIMPLILIAAGIYLVLNFPAIKDRLWFWIHKPNPGNVALFPSSTRTPSDIPVGSGAACGKPVGYNGDGTPKVICDNYIYIPKIRVAAPIVYPKTVDDKTINAALLTGVVHYPGTADPGQKGNVFLTGHSSYYPWASSDYKTVFSLVPQLVGGDEIVVYNKGIRYTYRVDQVYEVAPTHVDVLRPTPEPMITLSTCVPIGTSYRRKIVRAKQISPDPSSNRASSGSGPTTNRLPGVR